MDPYRSLDWKGSKMGGICITRMAQLMKVLAPSLMTHSVTVEWRELYSDLHRRMVSGVCTSTHAN